MSDTVLKDCADEISHLQVNHSADSSEYLNYISVFRLYQKKILVFKII
jgi:hypothetical protein